MVVNHIDKTYVTSDAATILKEVTNVRFSSKCSIQLPKCFVLLAKCRRKSVEMLPTSLLLLLENYLVMPKISSVWDCTPLKLLLDTNRL